MADPRCAHERPRPLRLAMSASPSPGARPGTIRCHHRLRREARGRGPDSGQRNTATTPTSLVRHCRCQEIVMAMARPTVPARLRAFRRASHRGARGSAAMRGSVMHATMQLPRSAPPPPPPSQQPMKLILSAALCLAACSSIAPAEELAPWGSNRQPGDAARQRIEEITSGRSAYAIAQGGPWTARTAARRRIPGAHTSRPGNRTAPSASRTSAGPRSSIRGCPMAATASAPWRRSSTPR